MNSKRRPHLMHVNVRTSLKPHDPNRSVAVLIDTHPQLSDGQKIQVAAAAMKSLMEYAIEIGERKGLDSDQVGDIVNKVAKDVNVVGSFIPQNPHKQ